MYKAKGKLHIGHVIKFSLNKKNGEYRISQSKKLLWEDNYPMFDEMAYHFNVEYTIALPSIPEISKVLHEKGVVYGCVLNYVNGDIEDGNIYISVHPNQYTLYSVAKAAIEARKDMLDIVKKQWEIERYNPKLYAFVNWVYQKCYCGRTLDPDILERCLDCTGYICTCGKCHCTEGKNFNQNNNL